MNKKIYELKSNIGINNSMGRKGFCCTYDPRESLTSSSMYAQEAHDRPAAEKANLHVVFIAFKRSNFRLTRL